MTADARATRAKSKKRTPRRSPPPLPPAIDPAEDRTPEIGRAPLVAFVPVLIGVAVLAFVLACFHIDDNDLWWQLRDGRWIAQHRQVPRTDTFTHTREGMSWIDTEWAAELLLYLTMAAGGARGLIVLVGTIAAVTACCLVLAARDEGAGPASAGLAAAGALFILHFRLFPRAEVFTVLCLSLLVYFLARWRQGRRQGRGWTLVGIPVLFLFWGNLHPGVLSGGLVLACYVTAEALTRLVPRRRAEPQGPRPLLPLFVSSTLAALALLVNPYGIRLPLEWLHLAAGDVTRYILEWAPPTHRIFTNRPFVHAYRLWTAILVISIPVLWSRRRLGGLLAAAAMLPMTMRSVRFLAVYGIATAPAMAVALHGWSVLVAARFPRIKVRAWASVVVGSVLVVVAVLVVHGSFYRWEGESRRFGFGFAESGYPVQALAFLRANGIEGTVYNDYGWGGWLGWFAGMKVFEDGRTIDETLFHEGYAVLGAAPGFERILDRYRVDVLILKHPKETTQLRTIFRWLAASPDWALVFWDDVALVYVKRLPRFQSVVDRFAYRYLFPFEVPTSKTALQNDWARVEAEVARVKTWSPQCGIIRQLAGQLYAAFGMTDRAASEYLEGHRLDPNNPLWESRLRTLGAWPPR